jgi:hypothetical protein
MSLSYGPLTCGTVGPSGPTSDCTIFDSGQLGEAITAVSATFNSSSTLTGAAYHVSIDWYDNADALISVSDSGTQHFTTTNIDTLTPTPPSLATRAVMRFGAALTGVITASCTGNGSITTTSYCSYGTRVKSSARIIEVVTEAAIAGLIAIQPELAFLAIGFGALIGFTWVPGVVCAGLPPAMPTFTNDDFLFGTQIPSPGSLSKFFTAFQVGQWKQYCECIPATGGAPAPITVPNPYATRPTGAPDNPGPINCDEQTICQTLDAIIRQMTAMSAQIGYVRSDVQLIQRQHVPFAYVPGTLHSGLSGSGTIAIVNVLGISVQVTTIPGTLSSDMAPVQSWFKLGELSFGTSDGWLARRIVTHNPHLFLDLNADLTELAYQFEPGVVANILELVREP